MLKLHLLRHARLLALPGAVAPCVEEYALSHSSKVACALRSVFCHATPPLAPDAAKALCLGCCIRPLLTTALLPSYGPAGACCIWNRCIIRKRTEREHVVLSSQCLPYSMKQVMRQVRPEIMLTPFSLLLCRQCSAAAAMTSPTPLCQCTREELVSDSPGSKFADLCPLCQSVGGSVPIGFHPSRNQATSPTPQPVSPVQMRVMAPYEQAQYASRQQAYLSPQQPWYPSPQHAPQHVQMVHSPPSNVHVSNNNTMTQTYGRGKEPLPVNHCCHCVLFLLTGSLWLPCWCGACCDCCCHRPCGC